MWFVNVLFVNLKLGFLVVENVFSKRKVLQVMIVFRYSCMKNGFILTSCRRSKHLVTFSE